ncbi:GCN5-related N-acetyltransferase [Mariniradius saccharolyticus AK6]|uniref:GCN5-related N-acetyltransferase n=1 Tax=Mariniradius saccharolyticus AK6 TaxID=1239962 RepID=M7Y4F4_9BACT|nr:GNAT family N-acetyltransferase [Mariniradius saccharolyticus]EMS32141.1 GCN5-related N-acetyltransferase [Mariniradius saccharolyticus AK6]
MMNPNFPITTPRLQIRPVIESDAEFVLALHLSPGWLAYIGDRGVRDLETAKRYIQDGPLRSYAQHGFGLWVVVLEKTGNPIGLCGLLKRDYLDAPDLGFAFLPEFQKMGYGFEAASAVLGYAERELGLERILATTLPHNIASIQLLEKLGFRFRSNLKLEKEASELKLYEKSEG